ncbi:hypothetical protein L249_1712 [Ophiocordyceps polyrhachis-furcata BCC 54312]|uniref:Uncharacterized protein n=1 Tax=Ophiocordyceps polyrhachis-furcata BCC 54312 TaxID=1330021 RepID=A0A367LQR7_9HYPO|nr:hypothetical protein L249_1712 [Ophiocordyceps polyrhachis-furcata BCC 54312]
MRYLVGYLALVATVTDAAIIHPRGDGGTFELTDVKPPFQDKLEKGQKYNFLKRRQGGYSVNSDQFKCHGSCGSLITLNKGSAKCKEPDNEALSNICFGTCSNAQPQAVYETAIQVGKDCGFLNEGWKNEEGLNAYTPPQSRPTREAPQEEKPKDSAAAAPSPTTVPADAAPSKPAESSTAPAVKPTEVKPAESTTTPTKPAAKDGGGSPVEVTNSGAKWSVSSSVAVTVAAVVMLVIC